MSPRSIFVSLDLWMSVIVAIVVGFLLPTWIKISFASGFYNIGITVLSIVFSIFFAALAIIMSSTDNDFIVFLEEEGHFTILMKTFKFTLVVLFVSLFYSITLYTCSDYVFKQFHELQTVRQHKSFFIIFSFLFSYSLLSTAMSVMDTITFTQFRTKFLGVTHGKK